MPCRAQVPQRRTPPPQHADIAQTQPASAPPQTPAPQTQSPQTHAATPSPQAHSPQTPQVTSRRRRSASARRGSALGLHAREEPQRSDQGRRPMLPARSFAAEPRSIRSPPRWNSYGTASIRALESLRGQPRQDRIEMPRLHGAQFQQRENPRLARHAAKLRDGPEVELLRECPL